MRWVRKRSSGRRATSERPVESGEGIAVGAAIIGDAVLPGPLRLDEATRHQADLRPVILMRENADDGTSKIRAIISLEQIAGHLVTDELAMAADIGSQHDPPA